MKTQQKTNFLQGKVLAAILFFGVLLVAQKSVAQEEAYYKQQALPYAYNALEPVIDAQTMELHYSKHHAGYTKKFNAAIENSTLKGKSMEEIFASLENKEVDAALRNNGGGYYNHTLYWELMTPGGKSTPTGDLLVAINKTFGSEAAFLEQFAKAGASLFGSGWVWLIQKENGELAIITTANQDNPLMIKIVSQTGKPLIAMDVWEHAYYLKYQNKRADYIQGFLSLLNWDVVEKYYNEK